ncbi:MAG: response regulator [Anaerolineae bacterium]|nr:response regulator [Anaerolineae bacterium]
MTAPSILVVDDDEGLRQLLRLTLQFAGMDVREAGDGLDALAQIRAEPPDLVLLDVMMPKMDGLTVCRTLRADPDTEDLPVMMISGKTDPRSIQQGLDNGANEYITKPFCIQELIARVKALLNSRSQKEASLLASQGRLGVR